MKGTNEMAKNYTLFWDQKTSAICPHVMLLELGVPFDLHWVDTENGLHKIPDFLKINPNGLMPTLRLPNGTSFGETAAIMLTLGERHPEFGLVPTPNETDRTEFLQWLVALATTGHTTLRRHCYPDGYTTRHDALDGTSEVSGEQLRQFFEVLESVIAGGPYFLKRGFGPLDIYLTMLLRFYEEREVLFEDRPKIRALYQTSIERASFQEVFDLHFGDD